MIKVKRTKKAKPEMVDLFSIDDRVYQMEARPPASVGLKYLLALRETGPDLALLDLLVTVIGQEGFTALSECEGLEREDWEAIREKAFQLVMGGLEPEPGNGGAAQTS